MNQNPLENRKPNQEKLTVRVEIATEKDWKAYKDLKLEAYTGPDKEMFGANSLKIAKQLARTDQSWKRDLFSNDMFVVLSWESSEAIGMGIAEKRDRIVRGGWHINSGYVKEGFRGRNIQSKMIAKRLEEIINRGGEKVTLAVKAVNLASIHNAESLGFKKVEKGSSENGFFMELDLTNEEVIKKINEVLDEG